MFVFSHVMSFQFQNDIYKKLIIVEGFFFLQNNSWCYFHNLLLFIKKINRHKEGHVSHTDILTKLREGQINLSAWRKLKYIFVFYVTQIMYICRHFCGNHYKQKSMATKVENTVTWNFHIDSQQLMCLLQIWFNLREDFVLSLFSFTFSTVKRKKIEIRKWNFGWLVVP